LKISFLSTFLIVSKNALIITAPVTGTTSVLIVLHQKNNLFETPLTCRTLHVPHHFVFSTYDRVFRTYRAYTSRSTCKATYTLSVKLSDFTVWRHTWRENWVNCEVLTDNTASLRTVLPSRLSHPELRSSLRESHSCLSLSRHIRF
jgi:hypothetical protein